MYEMILTAIVLTGDLPLLHVREEGGGNAGEEVVLLQL